MSPPCAQARERREAARFAPWSVAGVEIAVGDAGHRPHQRDEGQPVDEDGKHRDRQRETRRQPIFGEFGRPPVQSFGKIGAAEDHEFGRENSDEYFEKARNRRASECGERAGHRGDRDNEDHAVARYLGDDESGNRKQGGGECEDFHGGDVISSANGGRAARRCTMRREDESKNWGELARGNAPLHVFPFIFRPGATF